MTELLPNVSISNGRNRWVGSWNVNVKRYQILWLDLYLNDTDVLIRLLIKKKNLHFNNETLGLQEMKTLGL